MPQLQRPPSTAVVAGAKFRLYAAVAAVEGYPLRLAADQRVDYDLEIHHMVFWQKRMPERGYTLRDIRTLLGLKPRQVLHWAAKALVRPDVEDTRGSGTARLYSRGNLLDFIVARELIGLGFSVPRARNALTVLHKVPGLLEREDGIRLARHHTGKLKLTAILRAGQKRWRRFRSARDFVAVTSITLDLKAARKEIEGR